MPAVHQGSAQVMELELDTDAPAAFDMVAETLSSPSFESLVGAQNTNEVAYLAEFMNSTIVQCMFKVHDKLMDAPLEPVSCDNIDTVRDIVESLDQPNCQSPLAKELRDICCNPHFKALIEAHDDIAAKNFEAIPDFAPIFAPPPEICPNVPQDTIRMVGVRKNPDEPLGITVRKGEYGDLIVARIMKGAPVDQQELLHVGDIIKEINGQEVSDPDQLQEIMKKSSGSVTFKVIHGGTDRYSSAEVYLKAHFNYDPKKDNLIPCREAGLAFQEGDILQVVSMNDQNWWQAQKVDENGPSGLIPSQSLEERRKAFVRPEYDYTHKSLLCGIVTKKKRKMMYQTKQSAEFDRHDMIIYEEVTRMPPFQRKTLVLIGAQGVGRRTIKHRLCKADSSRFGSVIPHTTRPIRPGEVDGEVYWFITQEQMQEEIMNDAFLEYGEYEGNLYGTKKQSIFTVINQGKMCILDLNPQALKAIKTSDFFPFIVFIAAAPVEIMRNMHEMARLRGKTDRMRTERDFRNTLEESARIERRYKPYFDLTIVNDNMDETYNKLRKAIETLSTEPQWVPISWVY